MIKENLTPSTNKNTHINVRIDSYLLDLLDTRILMTGDTRKAYLKRVLVESLVTTKAKRQEYLAFLEGVKHLKDLHDEF